MAYGKIPKNYINLFEIAKLEGIKDIKNPVSKYGIEAPKHIEKLKPIAHLFREFEKGSRKSYAILQRHYEYWKRTGEVPKTSPGRPKRWDGDNKDIRIPAPPFYDRFKAGIERANKTFVQKVTIRDCIYLAMKEYMDRHVDIFYPDLGDDRNENNQNI